MSQLNITELRQQRAKIVEEMRRLQDGIDERGVESGDETAKFAKMEKDCRALELRIEREERLQEEEAKLAKSLDDKRDKTADIVSFDGIRYPKIGQRMPTTAEVERRTSYFVQGWLRSFRPNPVLEDEHIEAAKFFNQDLHSPEVEIPIIKSYRAFQREHRDLNVATPTKGQETIPEGFVNALEIALLSFGGMRNVADVIRTDTGNDLPWPTADDTSNIGELLNEDTTFGNSVDPSFGQVTFKAFKYSSKAVKISYEMLQDSAFDLGARIGEMLGIRIGRIQNLHFTTGAGTTLPKGLMVAAGLGKLATSTTTFTGDELVDLEHSLDPAYRSMNASWMMHDLVLAHVRKLKIAAPGGTGDQQYIWQPGLQAGVPDRLLGYPYTINQQMSSTFAVSEKLVAFGAMNKYKIRDVASIRLVRLNELYAQTDQVGFVAFMRSDGNLLDAGTDPVKYLALAAS